MSTWQGGLNQPQKPAASESSRRNFLKGTGAAIAGLVVPTGSAGAGKETLPTVPFGPHRVSRLIVGSNPIRGFAHFNQILAQHMLEYFGDERTIQFLLDCEKAGINTYQSSYFPPRLPRHLEGIRAAGSKLQWICLTTPWEIENLPRAQWTPEWHRSSMLKSLQTVAKLGPIAVAHHGNATDFIFRAGHLDLLKTYVDGAHDLGLLAGISVHNPLIPEILESKGWPIDFYMASLYYLTRRDEDFRKEIGDVPEGELYLAGDPPRMFKVIRNVSKPCLAYKVLAAGRKIDSPEMVRKAFEYAFQNIKPSDAVIVGMYPRFSDQIAENTAIVRELARA